jgi:hypothetical protein
LLHCFSKSKYFEYIKHRLIEKQLVMNGVHRAPVDRPLRPP